MRLYEPPCRERFSYICNEITNAIPASYMHARG
jgi:hypothetical protein